MASPPPRKATKLILAGSTPTARAIIAAARCSVEPPRPPPHLTHPPTPFYFHPQHPPSPAPPRCGSRRLSWPGPPPPAGAILAAPRPPVEPPEPPPHLTLPGSFLS